ncbi:MAG: D-amino-acid transaminase [Proteobacteria bacterium]|nr:D-amino-acid transaminase [Pseudomonadota bacterium]
MSRLVYINGLYVPQDTALIEVNDRGFQFGDGVYVVASLYNGRAIDLDAHLGRLEGYGKDIQIDLPFAKEVLKGVCLELIRRNRVKEGSLYIQMTRGCAPRVHPFPDAPVSPSLVMIIKQSAVPLDATRLPHVKVMSTPDIRWRRPHIKATSLLPTVLLRQMAKEEGCFDAWLTDEEGAVSEGASCNAYIVTRAGVLVTRPQDGSLVPGVTRTRLLALARTAGIPVEERPFTVEEAKDAAEAFLSAAVSMVKCVTHIDGHQIGTGVAGPITTRLANLYFDYCRMTTKDAAPVRTSYLGFKRPRTAAIEGAHTHKTWALAS